MKRLVVLLILAIPICAYGWMSVIGLGGGVLGGASSISDDFSGDLSAWTQQSGTWTIVSGDLSANSLEGLITHDSELDSASQWGAVQRKTASGSFGGLYFRFDGDTANNAYTVRAEENSSIVWRHCKDYTCTDIQTCAYAVSVDHYYGVEVSGSGNSTVVDVWDFGATLPERGSWGSYTCRLTNNPEDYGVTSGQEPDDGKYMGLYNGSADANLFDNFYGGTF